MDPVQQPNHCTRFFIQLLDLLADFLETSLSDALARINSGVQLPL